MAVIIDYDAGNLRSVQRACAEVGLSARISGDAATVAHAERIIFPGVGAAASAMKSLKSAGLDRALLDALAAGTPILGICLGCQISLEHSEEGDTKTLGLIEGRVLHFRLDDPALKIPHIGWNEVRVVKPHPLLAKVEPGDEFYFVHAYYPQPAHAADVYAETDYERTFASALGHRKSQRSRPSSLAKARVGIGNVRVRARWDGRSC